MDRKLKDAHKLPTKNVLIENLVISQSNFVLVMETLIQKLNLSEEGTRLQELTIDGLSKDLLFKDLNLAERFGRNALSLEKICIANIR